MNIRTVDGLVKRFDILIKKYGAENIVIDHGVANYEFVSYEVKHEFFKEDTISIFVKDFYNNNKVTELMTVTDAQLKKMTGEEYENWRNRYTIGKVSCSWDKSYPTIIEMCEY